jgi:hypothetical protein
MATDKTGKKNSAKRSKGGAARAPRTRDLRIIWGGARNAGMDEETLRDLVEDITGQRSISVLNATQRGQVIRDLEAKGATVYRFKPKKYPGGTSTPGKKTDMISAAQQAFIEDLWEALIKAGVENARSSEWRAAFSYRIIGKKWPQKKWEAGQIIEALKKRTKQERKKNG